MWRFLAACFALTLPVVVAGFVGITWFHGWFTAPGPLAQTTIVHFERGTSVAGIADRLEAGGVISDSRLFRGAVRIFAHNRTLKAGEYEIPAHAAPREIIARLVEADTVIRRLTVPEGLTVPAIVALINQTDGLTGQIADLPPEGSLLPETYHFDFGTDRAALIERMRDAMARTLAALWDERAAELPITTPEEAVVLASIVEKETGLADERPRVAGVFINRLRRDMRLQSDPTVIYGITHGETKLDRGLTGADLDHDSPYNTYRHAGLPPGPIANPGRDSIAAVLNPMTTNDLYFVADGTGGHAFAATLDEHNRNVAKWRRIERERRQAQE